MSWVSSLAGGRLEVSVGGWDRGAFLWLVVVRLEEPLGGCEVLVRAEDFGVCRAGPGGSGESGGCWSGGD